MDNKGLIATTLNYSQFYSNKPNKRQTYGLNPIIIMHSNKFELLLPCNNHAESLCVEPLCSNPSPYCNSRDCHQCQIKHSQFCGLNIKFSAFISMFIKRVNLVEEIQNSIEKKVQSLYKTIEIFSNEMKEMAKKQILTQDEISLSSMLEEKSIKEISPQLVKRVYSSLGESIGSSIQDLENRIGNVFKGLVSGVQQNLKECKQTFSKPVMKKQKPELIKPVRLSSTIELEYQNFFKKPAQNQYHRSNTTGDDPNPSFINTMYVGRLKGEDHFFDPSINSRFFDISQDGRSVVVEESDQYRYAPISQEQQLSSPFGIEFKITRLNQLSSIYVGLCSLKNQDPHDSICDFGRRSPCFLIRQNGQVVNTLTTTEYQKSKFTFKQGDTIEMSCIPWLGIIFKNSTTKQQSTRYMLDTKEFLNMCLVLKHKGNQIRIT